MADRAEELRHQLDDQRAEISRTVGQIENRVVPRRVWERRRYRMRMRFIDMKDRVMGNEEPEYGSPYANPYAGYPGDPWAAATPAGRVPVRQWDEGRWDDGDHEGGMRARAGEAGHRLSDAAHHAGDRLGQAPQRTRARTEGNPMAMGMIAFGVGLLAGSVLPESRRERELARRAEPQMQRAVEEAKSAASHVSEGMREPAREAGEHVKEAASNEARGAKEDATNEARATRDDVRASRRS